MEDQNQKQFDEVGPEELSQFGSIIVPEEKPSHESAGSALAGVAEPMTFEKICDELRQDCKVIETRTKALLKHGRFDEKENFEGQHGEMKANIMLTVRHLEDARMRVGKILQYAGDGVSILDKDPYKKN